MARTNFTTPVGRLLMGSLYKPQTTDADGKPLVVKSGPNMGQPKVTYFFAVGIPKNPGETHWSQTPWGQLIYKAGADAFPQAHQSPSFAWKVVDGDSTIPNKKGIAPASREGYRGHWVISFSSGFAPKIYNADGSQAIVEQDAVKLGYFVQVNGDVDGNGSQQNPGVFINHSMVALSAYGPEIIVGPDAASVGFGQQAALPAGASLTPPANFTPPAAAATPMPAPVQAYAPVAMPVPTPVQPNPAFLQVPTAPVAVPPAPVAPARVMLPAAQGASYEQLIAAGWNDALLVQHGMMQA